VAKTFLIAIQPLYDRRSNHDRADHRGASRNRTRFPSAESNNSSGSAGTRWI
jgi:hypothetical protein